MTPLFEDEAAKVGAHESMSSFEAEILLQVLEEATPVELETLSMAQLIDKFWKARLT